MKTDELRAKFEAFHGRSLDNIQSMPVSNSTKLHLQNAYKHDFEIWQTAHASRDAEVEALRRDAERYRWLRDDVPDTWSVTRWVSRDLQEEFVSGEDLDAAIGAAIVAKEQP